MIDSGTLLQGRFLIEDKIGMGGMGAVYRAVDQKFGSLVAIKRTFYGDAELAKAFEREARLLNGLHHPIFPHVSDYFSENGEYFLVMEYIEGDDLSELLKRGERFPVNTVLGWTLDLLDGLDYLHSQDPPVIHRDIKPHNMKLTSRGKIMLLDFGMAKVTSPNTLATKSVFGYSRKYSPFEQIEGTGTDERADIFSLGASVYHLLTGTPPIDVLRRVSAIVGGNPDPLVPASSVNADVPNTVSEIISTALALNAEHRFESARAMWNALEYSINAGSAAQNHEAVAVAETEPDIAESWIADTSAGIPVPVVGTGNALAFSDDDTTPVTTTSTPVSEAAAGKTVLSGAGLESHGLKRALRRAIPGSLERIRQSRSTVQSKRWIPIIAACVVIALLAIYLGFGRGSNSDDQSNAIVDTSVPTRSDSAEEAVAAEERIADASQDAVVPEKQQTTPSVETETKASHDRTGADRVTAKTGVVERAPAQTSESDTRTERRVQPAPQESRVSNRPRRVVKPAFEQPAVSSIEAIMTGVPYERRNRWSNGRDQWMTDEEIRRREIRRIMRENRRRQFPF